MIKQVFIFLVSMSLFACANIPELKTGAKSVVVTTLQDEVKGCKSMGMVYGYSDNGFKGYAGAGGVSQTHSLYDAQNKAYERGANKLLLINSSPRVGGTDTSGEAFLCRK